MSCRLEIPNYHLLNEDILFNLKQFIKQESYAAYVWNLNTGQHRFEILLYYWIMLYKLKQVI